MFLFSKFTSRSDEESELVHVFYSALNFKDVMVSSGQLFQPPAQFPTAPDVSIGIEYSGITSAGKRVMGIVCCEGLSLQLNTNSDFTWLVPDRWTLEDAATIPIVYATVRIHYWNINSRSALGVT